jgi:hypothetical protein
MVPSSNVFSVTSVTRMASLPSSDGCAEKSIFSVAEAFGPGIVNVK